MSEFKSSSFRNEDNSGAPDIVGVSTFTSPYYFVPPSGTTAERPSGDGLAPGMLRFNTDIGRLEVWRGDHWATILGESPDLNGGARGVFGGGSPGGSSNTIDYVTISSTGNALDFGDLTVPRNEIGACASSTRGLFGSGWDGVNRSNVIDYITISSIANAFDFGDLTAGRSGASSLSNSTRGIWAGGFPNTNIIDYVTIASQGVNAQDFGDLTFDRYGLAACSSPTRGLFNGSSTPTQRNVVDFITISTLGNAQDFGDLFTGRYYPAACSSPIRAIFSGGQSTTAIEYLTISTLGNAAKFGDLSAAVLGHAGCSSPTRGLFAGGSAPTATNVIEYVTIASTGNAVDFGDLTRTNTSFFSACSNAHGGL
jgi:hypothetical protein